LAEGLQIRCITHDGNPHIRKHTSHRLASSHAVSPSWQHGQARDARITTKECH
jgi:hypothetical protein